MNDNINLPVRPHDPAGEFQLDSKPTRGQLTGTELAQEPTSGEDKREWKGPGEPKIIHKTQTIKGTLTSRIETRDKNKEPYYYGFFKLANRAQDIPVVWKEKPNLTKGQPAQLTGQWASSPGSRPSFTCYAYTRKEVHHA